MKTLLFSLKFPKIWVGYVFSQWYFEKQWVGRAMGNETIYWDGLSWMRQSNFSSQNPHSVWCCSFFVSYPVKWHGDNQIWELKKAGLVEMFTVVQEIYILWKKFLSLRFSYIFMYFFWTMTVKKCIYNYICIDFKLHGTPLITCSILFTYSELDWLLF